jgi:hypothetical protein
MRDTCRTPSRQRRMATLHTGTHNLQTGNDLATNPSGGDGQHPVITPPEEL